MKYFALLLLCPTILYANGITDCGEYSIRGVVRASKTEFILVVNEKTRSEYKISMPIMEQAKIAGHIDKPVTVKALLNKRFDGTKGYAEKIMSTEFRLPDPMNPRDTGFTLDKKLDCKRD